MSSICFGCSALRPERTLHNAKTQIQKKQEILGNFQAAQSLSPSFPWAVMHK